jgi:hypothetical protein
VHADEDFEHAADVLFQLIKKAAVEQAGKQRYVYLDIEGHRNDAGGFDHDMYELQKEFLLGYLMRWLTEVHMPLGHYSNPKQHEDLPPNMAVLPGGPKAEREQTLREFAASAGAPIYDSETGELVAADGTRTPSRQDD